MSEGKDIERIDVMMPLEQVSGRYANYLRISHTPTEFILDFCVTEGSPNAHSVGRIIVNAINMKSFVTAIQENIARYESVFNIILPENVNSYIENGTVKKG